MELVYTIYKNPRYKIIQKDNQYLMIDLEQNWCSYLCPMLNWFIPIKYTKLTYQEFNNLNIFSNGSSSSYGMIAGGIGVTISVLLRSIVGLMDINISRIWMLVMFLIGFFAVVGLRLAIRKKLKHPSFNKNSKQKVRLIPSFKNFALVVFCYFMTLFLSIAPTQMIFDDSQNIIGYVGWLVVFFMFTTLNIFSILDRKVHAKIMN
ncbi:DUF443 family protein [Staphylococcus caprae]|uniref:DUF443 family protein n=1 Tax=Staphylococcus caprae TaxID=29380 RepID=UPI0005C8D799|nr:DUF443 family protein [Staphylococcus caprae]